MVWCPNCSEDVKINYDAVNSPICSNCGSYIPILFKKATWKAGNSIVVSLPLELRRAIGMNEKLLKLYGDKVPVEIFTHEGIIFVKIDRDRIKQPK